MVLLSEALPEELLFRGWLMDALGSGRSPWRPGLGQAAVFTLFAWAIGSLNSLQDASFIACFGLVLGIVRAVTGSIWAPVGVHLAFIATQQSALPQWAIWAGDPHPKCGELAAEKLPSLCSKMGWVYKYDGNGQWSDPLKGKGIDVF